MPADSLFSYLILVLAGMIAAAINSVAGGGTLISFPVLIATGVPAVSANATNAVALWPGSLASVWSYREETRGALALTALLTIPAVLGALLGAWALLNTPEALFRRVVPVLVLIATFLLWLQPRLKKRLERATDKGRHIWFSFLLQGLVSIYGGYFGAGMGIMMLASLSLSAQGTIHRLNAIKAWLGTIINLVAAIFFIISGQIRVAPGIAVGLGAVLGGYWGARLALRFNPEHVRIFIIIIGLALTVIFAWRL